MVQNCILNGTCGYIGDLAGSPVPSQNALFSTLWGTLRAIGCCTVSKPVQFQRFIPHVALRPLLPSLSTAFFMKHIQRLLLFLLHPSIHPSIHRSIDPSIHRSIHSSMHTLDYAPPYVYSDLVHIMLWVAGGNCPYKMCSRIRGDRYRGTRIMSLA